MLSPCSHSGGNPSFGNLNGLSLSQSVTSSPLLDVMMNPCPELASIVHLPRISDVVSTICVAPFFSGILSLSYPDTNQIWISVRYDGWNIFPRVITLAYLWPGKVMIPSTPGGRTYCYKFSLLARLAVLPWGTCKTYSISCSWWIIFVSKVWSSPDDHVNAISKHVYGTPIFNRNIWSPMLNVSCSIIQTPLYG